MKSTEVIKNVFSNYQANELIFASQIYKKQLHNLVSEVAYYKTLERMCKSGDLVKTGKGIYHLPKISKYGIIPLSDKEIVSSFTANRTGTIVGYTLYNRLNLTTQISKNILVLSSAVDGYTKSIGNVKIIKAQLEYTPQVERQIHLLDVLQNFNSIEDLNYAAFVHFAQMEAHQFNDKQFDYVIQNIRYKTSTIAFAREVLNYYKIENHLDKYLSSLSEYKYPRMEEIYEAARIS